MSSSEADRDVLGDVAVFDLAAIGMVVTDPAGRFCRVNPAFARLLGRDVDELLGQSFSSLTDGGDIERGETVRRDLTATAVDAVWFEKRFVRPDGTVVWVDMHVRALTGFDGEMTGFLIQAVDIGDRKQAETAAENSVRGLADAQRLSGLGSFEHDPATGTIYPSDQLRRMLGFGRDLVVDRTALMGVVHPDDRDRLGAAVRGCLAERRPLDIEHRLLLADGTSRWVQLQGSMVERPDRRDWVVVTVLDVTERKAAQDALAHAALHDSLTGLANPALLADRLDRALRRAERQHRAVAVLLVDLDDFKTVNDAFGHRTGDELLIAVARRLAGVARAGDIVARFKSDQFALFVDSGGMPDAAVDVAGRIAAALTAPFELDGITVNMTASTGVAIGQAGADSGEDLLRDAEQAMYRAKQTGKGRWEIADPALRDDALERLRLDAELRHGLDQDEIEVVYQPIVNSDDLTPAGVEALVRWRHPRRGLIGPDEFVGAAESTGLIVALGNRVLNLACAQAQAWRTAGVVDDTFYVSVNLSAHQLAEPTLVDDVTQALADAGLPPTALVLEITESALVAYRAPGVARLHALKALGVRLALDDYGTGYSSLNRLGELPVDIVKIDKSFVDHLTSSSAGRALVQSVIDVTRALGLVSVAEGVEHADQHAALHQMGCQYLQGYLFAPPIPAVDTALILGRLRSAPHITHIRGRTPRSGAPGQRPAGGSRQRRLVPPVPAGVSPDALTAAYQTTRAVFAASTPAEIVELVLDVVRDLGGGVVAARSNPDEAFPLDLGLGVVDPLLAVMPAELSVARLQLETLLPMLVDDARSAVQRLAQYERLDADANTDTLTGGLNRRALFRQLRALGVGDTVVLFDLDGFKQLNDSRGHDAGDEVLQAFGGLLRESVRSGDVVGRYGGDELVVGMLRTAPARAGRRLAQIRRSWADSGAAVTFSAGGAPVNESGVRRALVVADTAMYRAKQAGGDRWEIVE